MSGCENGDGLVNSKNMNNEHELSMNYYTFVNLSWAILHNKI